MRLAVGAGAEPAWATWCAAVAVILGAVLIFSPTCINLG